MAYAANMWEPFSLQNGHHLPAIEFGTVRTDDRGTIFEIVSSALAAGYRSFGTAAEYGNELYIGQALETFLPKYDLTCDDIYVTSKLSNADHGSRHRVLNAFANSEINLGFPPDLYLINLPGSAISDPKDRKMRKQRHNAWSAMAELYDFGRVNSIGVTNFTKEHLEELLKEYHSDIPVVNQVEWHPLSYDNALLEYCNQNSIQLQGYNSVGVTGNRAKLLRSSTLTAIANRYFATVDQVLLTWSLQRGVAVAPKSMKMPHIADNRNLDFKLSAEEVHDIDSLTSNRRYHGG